MIQRAKKEVFAHFLESGLLDRLDIAWIGLKMHIPIDRMDKLVLIADEVLGTIIVHAWYCRYIDPKILNKMK